jgi:tetratricopeptide (TPR) repeat protein
MQGFTRIDELKQKFHENPRRYFAPLANEYRKAGDPEQAIAICRAHLAQQPGHMSGHVVYGQALYDAKRTDEARSVFEKALSLDPDNVIVLRHLGDIARQAGKSEEARHWYSKALDVDPQDTEIAAYLAELTEPLMTADAAPTHAAAADSSSPPEEASKVVEPEAAPVEQEARQPAIPLADLDFSRAPEMEREAPLEVIGAGDQSSDWPTQSGERPAEDRSARLTPQAPFVTRTMAELYAQQGHRAAAIEIYRQLAESDPDNQELSARIAELSARQTPSGEAPAVTTHFSDAELGGGDTWDTDVWGAGFSAEDSAVVEAFAEPDVESSPVPQDREIAQPAAERLSAEPEVEESAGEATADEDYLAAIPTEESFDAEQPPAEELPAQEPPAEELPAAEPPAVEAAAEEPAAEELWQEEVSSEAPQPEPVHAEAPAESDLVAYAPPVPDVDAAESITVEPVIEAPRTRTVREFFATLGARKPPEIPDRVDPTIAEDTAASEHAISIPTESEPRPEPKPDEYPLADDAFASLFAGAPVSTDDSRAAAALSAAVAHPPRKTPSPTVARPAVVTAPGEVHESEEDIKRFREWLDGLTES